MVDHAKRAAIVCWTALEVKHASSEILQILHGKRDSCAYLSCQSATNCLDSVPDNLGNPFAIVLSLVLGCDRYRRKGYRSTPVSLIPNEKPEKRVKKPGFCDT